MIAEAVMAKLVWNGLGTLGCLGLTGYSMAKMKDPDGVRSGLNQVLKASGVEVKHEKKSEYPVITKYDQPEDLDNVHIFHVKLPAGLSWKDVESKKDKIEQYFGGEVHLHRQGREVVIEILTKNLAWPMGFDEDELYEQPGVHGLFFSLGESRKGKIRLNLADFPHLLIGGQTGGGKSVCLRLILTMLFLLQPPENLEVHLIDLKGGIEFDLFERLPHVRSFSTSEEEVTDVLDEIIQEYEQRLVLFKQHGVPNITEYRALGYHMPFIMVVFDEFAELNPHEVPNRKSKPGEPPTSYEIRTEIHAKVSRLLRLARATGIHFVIATQRPDANALPGQLKGNIPMTIAFRTRNKLNSQILLESDSAGELPSIAGRAILQHGSDEQEIQVMYMSPQTARELLSRIHPSQMNSRLLSTPTFKPIEEPQTEEIDPDLL
jgi:S-DNA-T family DNA segregation ATPase FtsK/SpoIIIE